ncbi:MAG: DUF4386 domain-containing protein [Chloroflexota bacterium]
MTGSGSAAVYEIKVAGHLGSHWAGRFEEVTITQDGGDTVLTGPVADQAALHGLLKIVRDSGMTLLSVMRIGDNSRDKPATGRKQLIYQGSLITKRIGEEMITTNEIHDVSQRKAAIIAGAGLLLMIIPSIFAAMTFDGLFVPGDAAATASNILANEMQFRLVILSFLTVVVLDIVVAWGLYVFFKPVNRNLSLLGGWLRLAYAAVFAAAILNLGNALNILNGADALTALSTGQMQTQVWLALSAFNNGWDLGLAIFGFHLIVVGYLAFGAEFMPKLLGILVIIAGAGYVFDSVTGLLLPDFGVTVGQFAFIGEVLLALWLLVKGLSTKQWEKLALRSA